MNTTQSADGRDGILLYLFGTFLFAANDALGKWLVTNYSVAQVMALRGLGATLLLLPLFWTVRRAASGPLRWRWQLLRVICSAVDTYCFYAATRWLPLADVMTFYLAAPLIVTGLSALLLRERVGPWRWGAVLVGFVGVVVALRPGTQAFSAAALIAIAGALMFALTITITRGMRQTPWLDLVAFQVVGSGLVGGVAAAADWVTPPATDIGLMAVVGIVSMGAFMCITKALAIAPASLLAPFHYTSIVWAALFGWLVWGDLPTTPLIMGSAIIIASGLFVAHRERRLQAAGATP